MLEDQLYRQIKASQNGQDWHHKNCFGCGPENPKGLHASFPFHEPTGEVRFSFVMEKGFEGAPGYTHGGALATLMDEAQGVLCFHLGHFVMTDQLYMRYLKACPLGAEIEVRCWVTMVRRRRLYTKGTVHLKKTGELLLSSKARWYDMPEKVFARMFQGTVFPVETISKVLEENQKRGKEIRKRLRKEKAKQQGQTLENA
ncbi:thioesterase family protein [Leptospira broomii serovar Hurstbridge str. 5399]|uniref:Acyl-coenzyme A thioesterase THEM4 n=1 Tax=Leptospira broomii serovar Hurstbridge str. 5399 TaxID=1049789 RepID=T0FBH4_9LEPT|nr:PaaI family thioesterase [Leptospira broomii]EQA45221.1 thioesterase family protein [Leptospira broomii serovar Hurstbridge str. 5399]